MEFLKDANYVPTHEELAQNFYKEYVRLKKQEGYHHPTECPNAPKHLVWKQGIYCKFCDTELTSYDKMENKEEVRRIIKALNMAINAYYI